MNSKRVIFILLFVMFMNIFSFCEKAQAVAPAIPIAAYYALGGGVIAAGVYSATPEEQRFAIETTFQNMGTAAKQQLLRETATIAVTGAVAIKLNDVVWRSIQQSVSKTFQSGDNTVRKAGQTGTYQAGEKVSTLYCTGVTYTVSDAPTGKNYGVDTWTLYRNLDVYYAGLMSSYRPTISGGSGGVYVNYGSYSTCIAGGEVITATTTAKWPDKDLVYHNASSVGTAASDWANPTPAGSKRKPDRMVGIPLPFGGGGGGGGGATHDQADSQLAGKHREDITGDNTVYGGQEAAPTNPINIGTGTADVVTPYVPGQASNTYTQTAEPDITQKADDLAALNSITAAIGSLWRNLTDSFSQLKDWIGRTTDAVSEGISALVGSVADVWQKVEDVRVGVVGSLKEIWDAIQAGAMTIAQLMDLVYEEVVDISDVINPNADEFGPKLAFIPAEDYMQKSFTDIKTAFDLKFPQIPSQNDIQWIEKDINWRITVSIPGCQSTTFDVLNKSVLDYRSTIKDWMGGVIFFFLSIYVIRKLGNITRG